MTHTYAPINHQEEPMSAKGPTTPAAERTDDYPSTSTARRLLAGDIDEDLLPAFTAALLDIEREAFWKGVKSVEALAATPAAKPEAGLNVELLARACHAADQDAGGCHHRNDEALVGDHAIYAATIAAAYNRSAQAVADTEEER